MGIDDLRSRSNVPRRSGNPNTKKRGLETCRPSCPKGGALMVLGGWDPRTDASG